MKRDDMVRAKKAAHAHAHQQRTRTRNSKGRRVIREEGRQFEQKTAVHEHDHQLRTRPRNREGIWNTEPTSRSICSAYRDLRHNVASTANYRESWFVRVFRGRFGCTCASHDSTHLGNTHPCISSMILSLWPESEPI